jgi:hypothetical protein
VAGDGGQRGVGHYSSGVVVVVGTGDMYPYVVTHVSPRPTTKQCHVHVRQPQVGGKFIVLCVFMSM